MEDDHDLAGNPFHRARVTAVAGGRTLAHPTLYFVTTPMPRGPRSTPAGSHRPVMLDEVLAVLNPQPGAVVVDATLGFAGHSQELLRRTRQPVKQIAHQLGFRSEKSFARAFRHWTGHTPSDWRAGEADTAVGSSGRMGVDPRWAAGGGHA